MKTVVKSGVFDPREYKKNDSDWAKKRKPEYMGPGRIIYTREVQEDDRYDRFTRQDRVAQYRERLKSQSKSPEPEYRPEYDDEPAMEHFEERPELITPEPERVMEREPEMLAPAAPTRTKPDLWPKRVRSDITAMFR